MSFYFILQYIYYMKKIIFFILFLLTLGASFVFSYSLNYHEIQALDRAEEKIFSLIDDTSNPYSAEIFVDLINRALISYDLSERQRVFLEIILDDIQWEYGIWEYYEVWFATMLPEDCYEDEYYDEQDQMCYYSEDEYYDDDIEYDFWDSSHQDYEYTDAEILASYSVNGDRISLESWKDDIKNQEVWNIFTSLIPLSGRQDIVKYEVSNDEQWDTAAHVEQIPWDTTKWLMNINLSAFYTDGILEPEESYATLIHEFAHILTLNKTQVRYIPENASDYMYDRFERKCETNFLQEWCLIQWAYLNDFINTFWSDKKYLEQVRNQEVSAYQDTPESFVTDYAATNPGEDIAESFTYFVLRTQPEWNTIADEKLRFFYNYKELDSLRKQIRSNLAKLQ